MELLLSCADWAGLEGPLASVTSPSELGSIRMIVSVSLLATDQPGGTGTVSPSFDSVVVAPGFEVGEATGVGDTPGDGLVSGLPIPEPPGELRLPMTASAVPNPAINTVRARTPAMIRIHGVRWTGAVTPDGV